MPKPTTPIRAALQLVDELSVPGLDPCDEECLRQAQDQHPALDVPAGRTFGDVARTYRRAS